MYHNDLSAKQRLTRGFFSAVKSLPILREKIAAEIEKEKAEVRKNVVGNVGNDDWQNALPRETLSPKALFEICFFSEILILEYLKNLILHIFRTAPKDLEELMVKYVNYDTIDWKSGKLSGTTFTCDDDLSKTCKFAFEVKFNRSINSKYILDNPSKCTLFFLMIN